MKKVKMIFAAMSVVLITGTAAAQIKVITGGNVGIANTAPAALLHVGTAPTTNANISTTGLLAGSASGNLYPLTLANTATVATNNTSRMSFVFGTSASSTAYMGAIMENSSTSATGLQFATYNGSLAESMRISAAGYVGIGTTAPNTALHLNNASGTGPQITLSSSNSGTPGIAFRPYQDASAWSNPAQALISATDSNYSANIRFWTKTPGAVGNSLTERITIQNSGKVGIGTTKPTQALQVNGTVLISGTSSKFLVNDTGRYVGIARNGADMVVNNNTSNLLRIGSNNGIGFYASTTGGNDANATSAGSYNMYLNQYGLGIGASAQAWSGNAFYVNGNSYFSGTGYSTGSWTSSDARFKTNIQPIDNAIQKLMKLNGKSFMYKQSEFPQYSFNAGISYGFIAQELVKEMPQVVRVEHDGYYSVNYEALIPILTEAIKSQNNRIDSLQSQLNLCCSKGSQGIKIRDSGINPGSGNNNPGGAETNVLSGTMALLFQNTPNPFNQQTSIGYYIPSVKQNASIMVFDLQGKLIKTIPVTNFGNGSVTINGSELHAGMFVYSLIIDGKEIDTKRMILKE